MPTRMDAAEMAVYAKPRHPDFDAAWEQHHGLVYDWAWRMARFANRLFGLGAGGPGRRGHWERGDFLGYLTARLNYVLYCWDPGRGAFSTLFCAHLVPQTFRMVVWIDRERYNRDDDQQKTALEAYAYERGQRYHLYRTPEDFRWEEQMLELLGDDPWGKLMFNIPERSRTVLEWRFRDGKTLRQVGALLGLTAERVRQIERDTLKAVRTRIERYEPARRLFFGEAA